MVRTVNATAASSSLLSHAVERAKAGDCDALTFLYARFADDVCGYLQGVLTDAEEAEEIAECVFAQLPCALGGHQERNMPFLVWLLRFAREIAADQVNERGPAANLGSPSRPPSGRAILPLSRSAR
jgi:RNA polymerase sigma-70 factor (ECF subfamily)